MKYVACLTALFLAPVAVYLVIIGLNMRLDFNLISKFWYGTSALTAVTASAIAALIYQKSSRNKLGYCVGAFILCFMSVHCLGQFVVNNYHQTYEISAD
jgi:hypothetical protein